MSIPVTARCEDTLTRGHFRKWIIRHIYSWFAFTQLHGLDLEMEDIVFVTGCHRTRSWSNITFTEVQDDARFTLQVEVTGTLGASVNWRASSLCIQGAVYSQGPSGEVCGMRITNMTNGSLVTESFDVLLRTYLRINAYLYEDIVSNVFSGYFRGPKERQNPSQIHVVTASQRRKWTRYPVLLLR